MADETKNPFRDEEIRLKEVNDDEGTQLREANDVITVVKEEHGR